MTTLLVPGKTVYICPNCGMAFSEDDLWAKYKNGTTNLEYEIYDHTEHRITYSGKIDSYSASSSKDLLYRECDNCHREVTLKQKLPNQDTKEVNDMAIELKDWESFEGKWVKLETDTAKEMVLSNWRTIEKPVKQGSTELKAGLGFDVLEINGEPTEDDKVLETTSLRLINKLKPIVQKAQTAGKTSIKVSITKTGEGFDTRYIVKEVA